MKIKFVVNKKKVELEVKPHRTLLEVLREDLGYTGVKEGCSTGECGACTVIMDGKAVPSCLVLIPQANGKRITTIEGLAENGKFDPVQDAFVKHGAIQCGFCSPGFIMSAKALLDKKKSPTDAEIKKAIEGNICRCTGYTKIIDAIKSVK